MFESAGDTASESDQGKYRVVQTSESRANETEPDARGGKRECANKKCKRHGEGQVVAHIARLQQHMVARS